MKAKKKPNTKALYQMFKQSDTKFGTELLYALQRYALDIDEYPQASFPKNYNNEPFLCITIPKSDQDTNQRFTYFAKNTLPKLCQHSGLMNIPQKLYDCKTTGNDEFNEYLFYFNLDDFHQMLIKGNEKYYYYSGPSLAELTDRCSGQDEKTALDKISSKFSLALAYGMNVKKYSDKFPSACAYGPAYQRYLVINSRKEDVSTNINFMRYSRKLEYLCKKHSISPLPGHDALTGIRIVGDLIKFEFYISLDDFDNLLTKESENYTGYRSGNSLLILDDPTYDALKDGVICLFPAWKTSGNQFLLRSAGCNMSEKISAQLLCLIRKYLPEMKLERDYSGHHMIPSVGKFFGIDAPEIFSTVLSCMQIPERSQESRNGYMLNHQTEDGFSELNITEGCAQYFKPMNPEAKKIHRTFGVVPADELENLSSVEVPTLTFFQHLKSALKKMVERYEIKIDQNKDNPKWFGRKYAVDGLEKTKDGLKNLESLIKTISSTKKDDNISKTSEHLQQTGTFANNNNNNNNSNNADENDSTHHSPSRRDSL